MHSRYMSGLRVSFSLCASLGPFSTTCSRLQDCTQSYTDHVIVVNPIFDEILLSQQDPGITKSAILNPGIGKTSPVLQSLDVLRRNVSLCCAVRRVV